MKPRALVALAIVGTVAGRVGAASLSRWERQDTEVRAVAFARTIHHRWHEHHALCVDPSTTRAGEVLCVLSDGRRAAEAVLCGRSALRFTCRPAEGVR